MKSIELHTDTDVSAEQLAEAFANGFLYLAEYDLLGEFTVPADGKSEVDSA